MRCANSASPYRLGAEGTESPPTSAVVSPVKMAIEATMASRPTAFWSMDADPARCNLYSQEDRPFGGKKRLGSPPCYHSAMEFNPSDGSQRASFELLPEGTYEAEVIEAEERTSQKGNDMIALTLQVAHPDGYEARVWDYLVSVPAAVFKIRMFCEAAGLDKQYQSGRLTAKECIGKKVSARIGIEEGRDGFGDRNTIFEYMTGGSAKPAGIATMPETAKADSPPMAPVVNDDEIPF